MKNIVLPESQNWDHYWSLEQTQRFTKISWSKRRIISILKRYLKTDGIVLDAGCGSGFFSKYFCDHKMTTVALDYAQEALTIAEKMTDGKAVTIQRDLLNDDLAVNIEHRFDIIFSDGLLEHFVNEDQNRIIRNLSSVLKDDGVIITFVPNKFSPWELIRPFYMPGIEEDPFTFKQLIALNERNNLCVKESGGINVLPFTLSPDRWCGKSFGMLLYTISGKKDS